MEHKSNGMYVRSEGKYMGERGSNIHRWNIIKVWNIIGNSQVWDFILVKVKVFKESNPVKGYEC